MKAMINVLTIGFIAFVLWVIYMANSGNNIIFFDLVKLIPYGDKLGHTMLFGLLTLGVNHAYFHGSNKVGWFRLYGGTILVSIFVCIEEYSQSYFPTRTLDLSDLVFSGIGISLFTGFSRLLITQGQSPNWPIG